MRTEQAYVHWAKRFILYHHKRHPKEMGATEVEAFLSDLVIEGGVSASTHQEALSALLFLYKEALAIDLPWLDNLARLLYGTGMRLMECAPLRVNDVEFERGEILIRWTK